MDNRVVVVRRGRGLERVRLKVESGILRMRATARRSHRFLRRCHRVLLVFLLALLLAALLHLLLVALHQRLVVLVLIHGDAILDVDHDGAEHGGAIDEARRVLRQLCVYVRLERLWQRVAALAQRAPQHVDDGAHARSGAVEQVAERRAHVRWLRHHAETNASRARALAVGRARQSHARPVEPFARQHFQRRVRVAHARRCDASTHNLVERKVGAHHVHLGEHARHGDVGQRHDILPDGDVRAACEIATDEVAQPPRHGCVHGVQRRAINRRRAHGALEH
mmetsp:Transcript_44078/g.108206  ORF Transcript_44078/g.108206 Transcript_44078/m.108206 type:complete len:280 (+) Transcript_44078:390-1229(+)